MTNAIAILSDYSTSMQSSIEKHSMNVIHQDVTCGYAGEIYKLQKDYVEQWTKATEEITTYASALNANQQLYISQLSSQHGGNNSSQITIGTPRIQVKNIILGAILGAIVGVGYLILSTIFGGTIQAEDEILRRISVQRFGRLKIRPYKRRERILNKLLYGRAVQERDEQLESAVTRIATYCQSEGIKSIGLFGTTRYIRSESIKELLELLAAKGVHCEVLGNVLDNTEAYVAVDRMDRVILVETLGLCKIKRLYDEALICKSTKTDIVGYLLLDL
jgi:hypothetical protein